MRKLQYAALRKCTGAVMGARKESVDKITVVESVETFFIHAGPFCGKNHRGPTRGW